jgi:hypothetical protein
VKHCESVPPYVGDFFHHEVHRTGEKKKTKLRGTLLRGEVASDGNVVHQVDSDNDEKLQQVLHASWEEEQYARRVRQQGGRYDHGCESSQQQAVNCLAC